MRGSWLPLFAALGCDAFSAGGETVVLDAGGGGAPPTDPLACESPGLADDFEDGVVGGEWTTVGTEVTEADGALVIQPAIAAERVTVRSNAMSFADTTVAIELQDMQKADLAGIHFQTSGFDDTVSFYKEGANLVATSHVPSSTDPLEQVQFAAGEHRFWRIVTTEGESLVWQTSTDGIEWEEILSAAWLDFMTNATLELFATDGENDPAAYERIVVCPR
jgi:hypothetical protein